MLHIRGPKTVKDPIVVNLPGSKSIINRHLFMCALQGKSTAANMIAHQAEDTRLMYSILRQIDQTLVHPEPVELYCGNAGAVLRMASVYAGFRGGTWIMTGDDRIRQRPIPELISLLRQAGVKTTYLHKTDYPPLLIESEGFKNNLFQVTTAISSQHLSGLLMTGPFVTGGITITHDREGSSWPYVWMTIQMMREAGAHVKITPEHIFIPEGGYPHLSFRSDADWSSAAFFLQATALSPAPVTLLLRGLSFNGLQGDERAASLFKLLGVSCETVGEDLMVRNGRRIHQAIEADFSGYPDLVPAFAVAAAALQIHVRLTGTANLVHKESDRIHHLMRGLTLFGFNIQKEGDDIVILPGRQPVSCPQVLDSAGDHRIAMAFSMLGLRYPVIISDPDVAGKSFPGFYTELAKIADICRP